MDSSLMYRSSNTDHSSQGDPIIKVDLSKTLSDGDSPYKLCGIPYRDLTFGQRRIYDKYAHSSEVFQRFHEAVRIVPGQIEFPKIKLAIQDRDATPAPVDKRGAETIAIEIGNGWRLPKDKPLFRGTQEEKTRHILSPESSDYDAMLSQMPGVTRDEKFEDLADLIGVEMEGYWTGTEMHDNVSIIRIGRNRYRRLENHTLPNKVRLVRDL